MAAYNSTKVTTSRSAVLVVDCSADGSSVNRVTRRIRLEPFTLTEVRAFLASRKVHLEARTVIEKIGLSPCSPWFICQ